jgi:ankyrin repeat protein
MKLQALARISTLLFAFAAGPWAHADSTLADAVEARDDSAFRTLLRRASNVNEAQVDGMTALHWAAKHDDLEIADRLLRAGADFGVINRMGVRPIQLATVNGSAAMIERLLEAGEDPNAVLTPTFENVLMLTAHTGNAEAVQLLIDHGADVNSTQARDFTALMFAAAEGHADVIEVLLANGADPGMQTIASEKRERRPAGGMTPLIFAARQGHIEAVRALVDGGANVDRVGADGTNALLIAVINGRYDVANMLLERGANPSLADSTGRGALYSAIDLRNIQWSQAPAPRLPQSDHWQMIGALVEAGANLEQTLAAQVPHRGSFDMRWTELQGGTPLLRAAWNGDIEVMRYLLAHGADPYAVTAKGETALLLLTGAGWPLGQGFIRSDEEIIAALDLLIGEYGMDVNSTTNEGITGLMAAVFKGTNNVVEYLVEKGADLGAVDNEGRTILTWAKGIAANTGQPPRPQPESEALVRKLAEARGITLAMVGPVKAPEDQG